jgi:hypothetical protein
VVDGLWIVCYDGRVKKIIVVVAGLVVGALVWGSTIYCPWWRVRVVVDTEAVHLELSRIKLAYVMAKLGVWNHGMRSVPVGERNTGNFVVPKWVMMYTLHGHKLRFFKELKAQS